MAEEIKKTTRKKATAAVVAEESKPASPTSPPIFTVFASLLAKISQSQTEFEALQKEVDEARKLWQKKQEEHRLEIEERDRQEEQERKQQQETYEYETLRARKKAEDEFTDKKALWEKQLRDEKEVVQKERQELVELRKLVAEFPIEKEKAVKDAQALLQKQLNSQFEVERKLREQEVKAQIDLLNLQLTSTTAENTKSNKEIETLKRALDEATRQVKDIALKVIEARRPLTATQTQET